LIRFSYIVRNFSVLSFAVVQDVEAIHIVITTKNNDKLFFMSLSF